MKTRKTARDIMVDMLTTWGEWEAVGYAGGMLRETAMGKLAHGAYAAPRSAFGPALPLAVLIPDEVTHTGRLVQDMRDSCRAGDRYYRLIFKRFVRGEQVTGDPIERAIKWLAAAWVARARSAYEQREQSAREKHVA